LEEEVDSVRFDEVEAGFGGRLEEDGEDFGSVLFVLREGRFELFDSVS
jgi:hypothetical protein